VEILILTVRGVTKESENGRTRSLSYSPTGNSSANLSSSNEDPPSLQGVRLSIGESWLKDMRCRKS
jgi:hypothetical protein